MSGVNAAVLDGSRGAVHCPPSRRSLGWRRPEPPRVWLAIETSDDLVQSSQGLLSQGSDACTPLQPASDTTESWQAGTLLKGPRSNVKRFV